MNGIENPQNALNYCSKLIRHKMNEQEIMKNQFKSFQMKNQILT